MAFKLIWEQRRVTIKYSEHVNDVQTAMAARLIQGDPRSDGLHEILHDGRDCTSFTFSESIVEEIAAMDGAMAMSVPRLRIAIVANRPEIIAAVDYYAGLGLSPFPVRVFGELDAADAWLRG